MKVFSDERNFSYISVIVDMYENMFESEYSCVCSLLVR